MFVIIKTKPLAHRSDKIKNDQDGQCDCEQLDIKWLSDLVFFSSLTLCYGKIAVKQFIPTCMDRHTQTKLHIHTPHPHTPVGMWYMQPNSVGCTPKTHTHTHSDTLLQTHTFMYTCAVWECLSALQHWALRQPQPQQIGLVVSRNRGSHFHI